MHYGCFSVTMPLIYKKDTQCFLLLSIMLKLAGRRKHISAMVFNLMDSTIEITLPTFQGYNWASVSTEASSETQTFEVTAIAPPGVVLLIQQVCNSS